MTDAIIDALNAPALRQGLIIAAIGLTVWAAVSDLVRFQIPNRVSALLFCGGAVYIALTGLPGWAHLAAGCAVLALGFAAYSFSVLGAGDAKLLAALAVRTGPQGAVALVLTTLVLGAILAVVWVMSRPLRAMMISAGLAIDPEPPAVVPYAVAIAAAAIPALAALWPPAAA
jgi:prepilin peptidase CpaA